MTREEMAAEVDRLERNSLIVNTFSPDKLKSIATELRKTCATCRNWSNLLDRKRRRWSECDITQTDVPVDGSGFCHRWEAKP